MCAPVLFLIEYKILVCYASAYFVKCKIIMSPKFCPATFLDLFFLAKPFDCSENLDWDSKDHRVALITADVVDRVERTKV